ncbi:MAG: cysteine dioxygenase family protein [Thaumarchaeota archaeon]|nr:cysteine dioxygenase family protein [Nitrososphaerota archaeon]
MDLSNYELEQYVRDMASHTERWAHLVRHDPRERVYEQLAWTEDLNAWLICWSEDHETGFHDHDGSAVSVRVMAGEIREERLRLVGAGGIQPRGIEYGPGTVINLGPHDIHNVKHSGSELAVSIHAYSPPLVRMGSYGVGPDRELRRLPMFSSEPLRPLEAAALASIEEDHDGTVSAWHDYPAGEQPIST